MVDAVPVKEWKLALAVTLLRLGLIPDSNYSGKVNISLQDGGVKHIEKVEVLK